jgi:hypothetical protein
VTTRARRIGRGPSIAFAIGLLAGACGGESASPAPSPPTSTAIESSVPTGTDAPPDTVPPSTAAPTIAPTTTSLPTFSQRSALLFDPAVLHEIAIEIDAGDLPLLDAPTDDRIPVRLTVDGSTIDDAGLRLKRGFGQFRTLDDKPGFSIETDEFVDDLTLFDVDRFTLGNAAWDHSFLNEPIVYEIYRGAGVPAPRTALARVTVNGELFGLYVMRETWDERLLAQYFADPDGNLYESTGAHDAPEMGLELRTNERRDDTSDLAAVLEVVATAPDEDYRAAIEELVDVDQLLTYWAIEALTGHHDGYAYDLSDPALHPGAADQLWNPYPNNFYVYHDPTSDRFVFLPHGADMALGMGGWSTYDVPPTTPVLLPPKAGATIASRLWQDPAFHGEFVRRVRQVLDEVWDVTVLNARADMLADLVRADGLAGSREFVTMGEFESSVAARKDFLTRRADSVRAELAAWEATFGQQEVP